MSENWDDTIASFWQLCEQKTWYDWNEEVVSFWQLDTWYWHYNQICFDYDDSPLQELDRSYDRTCFDYFIQSEMIEKYDKIEILQREYHLEQIRLEFINEARIQIITKMQEKLFKKDILLREKNLLVQHLALEDLTKEEKATKAKELIRNYSQKAEALMVRRFEQSKRILQNPCREICGCGYDKLLLKINYQHTNKNWYHTDQTY